MAKIIEQSIDSLIPDNKNFNKGTEFGDHLMDESLPETRPQRKPQNLDLKTSLSLKPTATPLLR